MVVMASQGRLLLLVSDLGARCTAVKPAPLATALTPCCAVLCLCLCVCPCARLPFCLCAPLPPPPPRVCPSHQQPPETLANKDLKKKMSPTNAKALNTMRQRIKKHNSGDEFGELVTKYRWVTGGGGLFWGWVGEGGTTPGWSRVCQQVCTFKYM